MNDDDRPSRGNVRVKRNADARPVCRLSLSLSFALSRADDDDGKKISTTQRKEIYIKISFEFKKITPRPRRKGVSRANYIAPRHHHHHHSRLQSRAQHTQKKRTFIGAAGIFAPLKDDDLFADDEDGARIVASGWTVSVEDNILYVILLCVLVFG